MRRPNDIIKNRAFLDCELCGKCHIIESNEVAATRIKLRVIKEQDCNFVFEGDKICYRVLLCNDSCVDLHDLEFRDILDEDTRYEPHSFEVNGVKKHVELRGRTLCYHINELKENEKMILTFKAEVL